MAQLLKGKVTAITGGVTGPSSLKPTLPTTHP